MALGVFGLLVWGPEEVFCWIFSSMLGILHWGEAERRCGLQTPALGRPLGTFSMFFYGV